MRIIDISMLIEPGMPSYRNRTGKGPMHSWAAKLPHDGVNESVFTINLHSGTHLDAPLHMTENAATSEEYLPLERLIAKARVFDLTAVKDGITADDLEPLGIQKGDFVLLKTANSFDEKAGGENFVFIRESAAQYLAEKGVNGVGIDSLGIEREQPGHKSHHALLDKGILILEGLRLAEAAPGEYTLIALPLKLAKAEGALTRAVLVEGL